MCGGKHDTSGPKRCDPRRKGRRNKTEQHLDETNLSVQTKSAHHETGGYTGNNHIPCSQHPAHRGQLSIGRTPFSCHQGCKSMKNQVRARIRIQIKFSYRMRVLTLAAWTS